MGNQSIIHKGIRKHQIFTNKLVKGIQDLYTENCNTLWGKASEGLNKWRDIPCSWMTLNILNYQFSSKWYVIGFLSLWSKYLTITTWEVKGYFYAHSFRSSVHSQLTPLLWAWGDAEHYGRRAWWRKTAQLMAATKHREREGKGLGPTGVVGECPQWHTSASHAPPSYSYLLVIHSGTAFIIA